MLTKSSTTKTEMREREGDSVLLEKEKENKLSPCYEKEPCQVISCYGDQVVLRSPQGVQYKLNLQHIKPFNIPDPKEPETPLQDAEPQTEPKPFETPSMAEDQVPMAASPPEDVPSALPTAEQPVRRSGRIKKRPKIAFSLNTFATEGLLLCKVAHTV